MAGTNTAVCPFDKLVSEFTLPFAFKVIHIMRVINTPLQPPYNNSTNMIKWIVFTWFNPKVWSPDQQQQKDDERCSRNYIKRNSQTGEVTRI